MSKWSALLLHLDARGLGHLAPLFQILFDQVTKTILHRIGMRSARRDGRRPSVAPEAYRISIGVSFCGVTVASMRVDMGVIVGVLLE
jgi:hypothetical protein